MQRNIASHRKPPAIAKSTRVLIVDDHPIVASGCRAANTSSIMRQKLGVRTSAELVRLAIDNSLA